MPASRSLTYLVAVSLDGFIAGPDGDISSFPVEGDHIEWLLKHVPETLPTPFLEAVGVEAQNQTFDTVVMGWNTYNLGLSAGLNNPYASLDQYVVSRNHTAQEVGPYVAVASEDPVELIRSLKAREGKSVWLAGGGFLASSMFEQIDRLVLKVNPIMLGSGIPLFGRAGLDGASTFDLEGSVSFESGVVMNTYERRR